MMNTRNSSKSFTGRRTGQTRPSGDMLSAFAAAFAALLLAQTQFAYAQSGVTLDNVSYSSLAAKSSSFKARNKLRS